MKYLNNKHYSVTFFEKLQNSLKEIFKISQFTRFSFSLIKIMIFLFILTQNQCKGK